MRITSIRYEITSRDDLGGRLARTYATAEGEWVWEFCAGEVSAELVRELTYESCGVISTGLWVVDWAETPVPPIPPVPEVVVKPVAPDKLPDGEILTGYEDTGFWAWLIDERHMSLALAAAMTEQVQGLIASGRLRVQQQGR